MWLGVVRQRYPDQEHQRCEGSTTEVTFFIKAKNIPQGLKSSLLLGISVLQSHFKSRVE